MERAFVCVWAAVIAVAAAWGPIVHRACVLAVLEPNDNDQARAELLLASTFADAFKGVLPAVHDLRHLSFAALSAKTPAERRVAHALALHVVADTLGDLAFLRHHPPLHADEVLADAVLLWRRAFVSSRTLAVSAHNSAAYAAFARTVAALLNGTVDAAAAERAARRFEVLVRADVLSAQLHHSAGALVALHRARGGLADLEPTLACVRAAGTHWLAALDAATGATDLTRAAEAIVATTNAHIAHLVNSGKCTAAPSSSHIGAPLPAAVAGLAVVFAAAAWGVVAVAAALFVQRPS